MATTNAPAADTSDLACVTASHLVRNFGAWQDRALGEPVYILHRGRPKLALASIDFLARLTHSAGQSHHDDRAALIDGFDEPVLLFDEDGELALNNRAAKHYFPLSAAAGKPHRFGGDPNRPLETALTRMARRVAVSRIADRLDLSTGGELALRIEASAAPLESGAMIILRDLTPRDRRDEANARLAAMQAAVEAQGEVAIARINHRGYIAAPSPSLARLAGASTEQLASARFVTLFDVATRVTIGDALERVLRGAESEGVDASLLVDGAYLRPVRVALSGIVSHLSTEGAMAVIGPAAELTEG